MSNEPLTSNELFVQARDLLRKIAGETDAARMEVNAWEAMELSRKMRAADEPPPQTSNTLLPCPFCGGKAVIHRSHDADGMLWVGVRCQGCGAASTQDWCSPGNDCPIFYEGIRNSWNRRPAHEPTAGVKCTHCNGKGYNEPIYDEQDGWIDETPCETCNGSGRITTVEQYLKTLPANWHEDSSLETWFPITAEELKRLKDERASQPPNALPLHGVPLDRPIWICSMCHGWNHVQDKHCTHTHAVTKDAGECGACDKPGEHCANVHGICSRHGGRAHETSARRQCGCRTPGCTGCGEFP